MHQTKKQEGIFGSLPILAVAFGESQGIKVMIGGDDATTDGQRILLPTLPTECTDTLRTLAMGYLMHETGHIVETSIPVFGMCQSPLEKEMLNVIEDVRMEAARIATYPGARRTLADLAEHIDREGGFGTEDRIESGIHPAQTIAYWLLTRLRTEVLGQDLAQTASRYDAKMRALVGDAGMVRLEALRDQVYQLTSTSEALGLARRFIGLLGDLSQEQPPESPSAQQSESDAEDDGEAGDGAAGGGGQDRGDPDADSQPDAGGSGGDGDGDSAEGSDAGSQAPQDGGATSQGDGSSAADQATDGQASEGAGHGGNGHGQSAQADGSKSPDRQALRQALEAGEGDIQSTDVGRIAAEQLRQQATQEVEGEVTRTHQQPVFRDMLDVERPARSEAPNFGQTLASSAQLRARLASAMEAQVHKRDVLRMSGRRVDGGATHRLFTDGRIFKRDRKVVQVNTAVMVLMDVSGSMAAQGRIEEARKATLALSAGIHQIHGCKVAAAAFPAIVVLKEFDEHPRPVSGRYEIHPRGSTPMAEAMIWAATQLAQRREERKMLMIATDGDPDDANSVLELTRLYAKSGVEVIGVGIQHQAVSRLFEKHVVVNSLNDLPGAMFNLLKGSMRRVA